MGKEREYILGTHKEELERLGLQHRVWRPYVLAAWQRAGITIGSKVLDIGAGPGYATKDLAEIVASQGSVTALERSSNFVKHMQNSFERRNVNIYEMDLMEDNIPDKDFDFAWCRWVACFVSSPELLVEKISSTLKKGGKVIFHEYINYQSWQLLPPNKYQQEFVNEVMKSWRAEGGEPDIAKLLPKMLNKFNFKINYTKPLVFCCSPNEYFWQWPDTFVEVNLKRQIELGKVTQQWANSVLAAFENAKENPDAKMITPLVLEIIAEKK